MCADKNRRFRRTMEVLFSFFLFFLFFFLLNNVGSRTRIFVLTIFATKPRMGFFFFFFFFFPSSSLVFFFFFFFFFFLAPSSPFLIFIYRYFAIYDGHGGRDCVEYVEKKLHLVKFFSYPYPSLFLTFF